jgi:hypothetical protein
LKINIAVKSFGPEKVFDFPFGFCAVIFLFNPLLLASIERVQTAFTVF